jgi:glycosyltransferase involved in cell wall biosynthesis
MSKKLNYFGPTSGNVGYASCARDMVAAMGENGVDISLIPTDRPRREDIAEIYEYLPNAQEVDQNAIALSHTVPRGFELCQVHGSKRFNYSVLEVDKIPEDWVDNLNQLDGAVTATKWGKKVYEKCGVKKVSVVPHGVDTLTFSPLTLKIDELANNGRFKFLAIGKFEPRKGYDLLFHAFADEFGGTDDAELLVQMHNPFLEGFNPYAALVSMDLPTNKNIHFLSPNMSKDRLAQLYASVDAFVLPTRGEGWGLPITEAMASSLPTIVTKWSGPSEYITVKNSYPIKSDGLVEPPKGEMFYHFLEGGKWADPNFDELRAHMRHVVDNPDDAERKGEQARLDMQEKWSWQSAGKKMAKAVGI